MEDQRLASSVSMKRVLAKAIPPAEVRRLSELSPLRATWSVVSTWGLIGATYAAVLYDPHPLVCLAGVVVLAALQHALAILGHEAAHHRLYSRRWLNDLVGRLCACPIGLSLITYRQVHGQHHQFLYTERDPDLALMAGYPRGRGYLLRKLVQDGLGLTTVKNLRYLYGGVPSQAAAGEAAPRVARTPETKRDQVIVAVAQLAMLAAAAASGQWLAYALWMLPLLTVYQVLLRLRALYEHGAPPGTGSPLQAARTTLAGPIANFFLFPHHVHYHVEHHLFPSIPHYRLPEAHRLLSGAGVLDDAAVVHGVAPTWRRLYAQATPDA